MVDCRKEWSTSCEDDSLTWETFSAVEDDDSDGDPDDIDDCEDGDRIDAVQLECPNSHTSLCKVAFPALERKENNCKFQYFQKFCLPSLHWS